jgi:hypothetical protein
MSEFVNAMVNGVSPGGQHYYPAFPYTYYSKMYIEDVMVLRAFLDTLPSSSNITESHDLSFPPHSEGLASWSERDIAYFFETGFTPDFDTVGGSMVEVQENMAHLPTADLQAISSYLKSLPGIDKRD